MSDSRKEPLRISTDLSLSACFSLSASCTCTSVYVNLRSVCLSVCLAVLSVALTRVGEEVSTVRFEELYKVSWRPDADL